jgi:hypothetical protein
LIPPLRRRAFSVGGFHPERIFDYDIDYLGGECQTLIYNIFTSLCVHKFSVLAILRSPATIWHLKLNNDCFLELDND